MGFIYHNNFDDYKIIIKMGIVLLQIYVTIYNTIHMYYTTTH